MALSLLTRQIYNAGYKRDMNWTWKPNTSGVMGLLTGPHQIFPFVHSSFTIRLSRGDLPVLAPEYAARAPDETIAVPVS